MTYPVTYQLAEDGQKLIERIKNPRLHEKALVEMLVNFHQRLGMLETLCLGRAVGVEGKVTFYPLADGVNAIEIRS